MMANERTRCRPIVQPQQLVNCTVIVRTLITASVLSKKTSKTSNDLNIFHNTCSLIQFLSTVPTVKTSNTANDNQIQRKLAQRKYFESLTRKLLKNLNNMLHPKNQILGNFGNFGKLTQHDTINVINSDKTKLTWRR